MSLRRWRFRGTWVIRYKIPTTGCTWAHVLDLVAVQLEERYKSVRSPHKIKGGVSGCVRECAEAQSKDFGLIATDKGWNCKPFLSPRLFPAH